MHRVRAMLKNCQDVVKSHFPPLVKLRRISQILSLVLFVWLVAWTKSIGSAGADGNPANPVNFFFKFDPLLALTNVLAGHVFYRGLGWALVILIPTFILGRFFCGWICPMGNLNHFLGSIHTKYKNRGAQIKSL